ARLSCTRCSSSESRAAVAVVPVIAMVHPPGSPLWPGERLADGCATVGVGELTVGRAHDFRLTQLGARDPRLCRLGPLPQRADGLAGSVLRENPLPDRPPNPTRILLT